MRALRAGRALHLWQSGTTETTLMDSLTDYPQIQYILALHEGVAVGMADAYALATGQVSVVNLHVARVGQWPGMLFNAWEGRSPILITPASRMVAEIARSSLEP
jgi:benzoylformate decarboxylase